MKEQRFISVETSGAPDGKGVERFVQEEKPLTQKDIEGYVDHLANCLKAVAPGEIPDSFFVEELSDEALFSRLANTPEKKTWLQRMAAKFRETVLRKKPDPALEVARQRKKIESSREDLGLVAGQLRRAVIEALRKRLSLDPELAHVLPGSTLLVEERAFAGKRRMSGLRDGYQAGRILKDEGLFTNRQGELQSLEPYDNELRAEAYQILEAAPKHKNILLIDAYDIDTSHTVSRFVNIKPFEDFSERSVDRPTDLLRWIVDGMEGAAFLEAHGLVLMDIKLPNIGILEERGKRRGVLFDLEGLVKEGVYLETRMTTNGYVPPEFKNGENIVRASEMVYQFGASLDRVVNSLYKYNTSIRSRKKIEMIHALARDMMFFDASAEDPIGKRITLSAAIPRLEVIIEAIDRKSVMPPFAPRKAA